MFNVKQKAPGAVHPSIKQLISVTTTMFARSALSRVAASSLSRSCATRRAVAPAALRFSSTDAAAAAPAPNAKLDPIVDSISKLTLTETADLISLLKKRLNISEIAVPVAAAPAAPAKEAAPAEEEKPAEKTQFTLKLEKIDAAQKAKVIKEIRTLIPSMNLVEAKKFVESAPQVIKKDVPKADAEKMKKALEAVGATVAME
ncbi:ribosomal protein L7/L12 C-terminal domain-domain-containing protein [Catenaria anguillulae PL171]|uniref:Ribosomal protein L7/L12 C-terminal domain-domain-containing protein n=1 Tax=Catenaria anguillulae PL171 TaxID=765915 RepID=A0A1Y2I3A8_9FUNG|nr:ribosomal protein L7/L12 C-terminal domain-domain-containing protein [Catenaria anguillulae PL171]